MKAIGSLSEVGWVTDPQVLMAKILEYYLYTDGSQSTLYAGNLINLPTTFHNYINHPEAMAEGIKDDIGKLLSRYYDAHEVETHVEHIAGEDYAVSLYAIGISESGERVNAGVAFRNNTSGVKDKVEIANHGHGLKYIKNIIRSQ